MERLATQEMQSVPLPETPVIPIVRYSERLSDPDIPYHIEFDPVEYARFLREIGVGDRDIAKLKIQIDHKGWPMMLGSFNMLTNTMRIHAGRLWDDYLSVLRIAECIADDERSDILGRKLVNWDLYTKRLPDYLKSAPKDRKLEFSRKILLNATNRKLNGVFQHEGKHAADRKNLLVHGISYGSTAAIMVLGLGAGHLGYYYIPMPDVLDIDSLRYVGWEALGVGVAWGFNYKIDIGERRARSIGEKYKNKPEWRNIIKLSPKTGEEP